jgi:succinate dehydrogenase subunit D
MKRSHEPIFWALFGAGGMLSALVGPVLILVTGLLVPAGLGLPSDAMSYERVHAFAGHWLGALAILAVISLFLWHAMHRVYHALHDLGVRTGKAAMAACYGVALVATLVAAVLLLLVR